MKKNICFTLIVGVLFSLGFLVPHQVYATDTASCPAGAAFSIPFALVTYTTAGVEIVHHEVKGLISSDTIEVETSIPAQVAHGVSGYHRYTQYIHLGSRQVVFTSEPIERGSIPGVVPQSEYTDLWIPSTVRVGDTVTIRNKTVSVDSINAGKITLAQDNPLDGLIFNSQGVFVTTNARIPVPTLAGGAIYCEITQPIGQGSVSLKNTFVTSTPYYLSQRGVIHAVFTSPNPPSVPVLLDIELYNANQQKIAQAWFDNVVIDNTGITEKILDIPQYLPKGRYTVKVGIFNPGWNGLQTWYDRAATVDLQELGQFEDGNVVLGSALANPPQITQGDSSTLLGSFISPDTQNHAVLDFELYDANGQRVVQKFYEDAAFPREGTGNFENIYTLQSPATLAPGVYHLSIGIFTPGWASLTHWYHDVAQVTVVAK